MAKRQGRIGVAVLLGAGLLWLLPVVTTAAGSAATAATNDIVLPQSDTVDALVIATNAAKPLTFGLQSPSSLQVCTSCKVGQQRNLNSYAAGTNLVFYIATSATGQHCLSSNTASAQVSHPSPLEWVIHWNGTCPGGGTTFTDLSTRILAERLPAADPYANSSSQHSTEVEPDTFAFGNTVVAAYQSGRFTDGGSSNIGWARSTNGGSTWSAGFLPSTTVYASPAGPYDRISDPSVAYDAKHGQWLISSLPVSSSSKAGVNVLVSHSTDAATWSAPVRVVAGDNHSYDKDWIACDNHTTSPRYGNCYVAWDDPGHNGRFLVSTSTDGGAHWSGPVAPSGGPHGFGTQPLALPNGNVVVIGFSFDNGNVIAFRSTNGGASFGAPVTVSTTQNRAAAGGLRAADILPSAEMDASGKIYVVWPDSTFRSSGNDVVMSTSTDGVTWTAKRRVPIDSTTSGTDHFFPGIGVDPATSGTTGHLGINYGFYPAANCTASTCRLSIGFISSTDGGTTWAPAELVSPAPMQLNWLASTNQGPMVGDYLSVSFAGGKAVTVVPWAVAPVNSAFREWMMAVTRTVPAAR